MSAATCCDVLSAAVGLRTHSESVLNAALASNCARFLSNVRLSAVGLSQVRFVTAVVCRGPPALKFKFKFKLLDAHHTSSTNSLDTM